MYKLKIDKNAEKYIKKLDSPTRKRILNALIELAENPFADTSVTRMKGYTNLFRKRVGDFRIIFEIDQGSLIVLVLKVGSRGDIYKK
ncbi:type II toxin-antitoxin system RelE/ParE family toxin [Virgibacillus dakarensis]|uniref:Plasmid stabilization protein n=1 Tax=Lentibacillus populi TaxID=1827502 RepID=A0A9W5X3V1_9BACI|nr:MULTISPECIES: type II toxin-antitoxin system RelE/ParE family toxin [Bacillaceae]MBT2216695.1 type II toxin-antitoxin system RelE/ParE family toxin [Virgibacillus dakarensis]MTW86646.1 type II toxin-antitoxin system RelE/ParE family toxin [Virgibacillus dakarensis]GGB30095.1 plasmid stabilization protein [Lentibacillus populi]